MPRKSRKSSESNYYHVMIQGINKEYIFKDEFHIKYYRDIIFEKLKESNINILAYCIMNNHAHFLIYSEKTEDLSKFMQKTNTAYSFFYNSFHKRVGYVFRNRFLSQEILSQRQLFTCLKYIHNNPIKAKIVEKFNEYPYSSYNEFIEEKRIISEKSIELIFGNNKEYKSVFKEIHNNNTYDGFFKDIKEKNIDTFISEYEELCDKKISDFVKDKNLLKDFIKNAKIETDVTTRELAEKLGISKSTVSNYSK